MIDARETAMDLIFGRWRSQILYAGVKLGFFEALADGPGNASEVAGKLAIDSAMTYRLLRGLSCIGVLDEDAQKTFSITSAGDFFRHDHPHSLSGVTLLEEGPEHYAVWKHLCDIIRDGQKDGFVREYGRPVFEHTDEDPDYAATFHEAMTSFSSGETAMVLGALEAIEFPEVSHVCDVGGGHGHLLCSLLAKFEHLQGTVYELPGTIGYKEHLWAGKLGVEDRCSYAPGDMFQEVPAADVYFMKHILHDWNDEECLQILRNLHQASEQHSRVFIAEFIVTGPDTPHFAKLFDIHMMCATTGAERTEKEYAALLEQAGWKHAKTWYPAAGPLGVVEGTKG